MAKREREAWLVLSGRTMRIDYQHQIYLDEARATAHRVGVEKVVECTITWDDGKPEKLAADAKPAKVATKRKGAKR